MEPDELLEQINKQRKKSFDFFFSKSIQSPASLENKLHYWGHANNGQR